MVKFLKTLENRGTKIAQVNSIVITKSVNLQLWTLISYGVGVRGDQRRFPVLSPFIENAPPPPQLNEAHHYTEPRTILSIVYIFQTYLCKFINIVLKKNWLGYGRMFIVFLLKNIDGFYCWGLS